LSEDDRSLAGDRDVFYLAHMLECIESIERYTAANSIELDELTQDAVLRKLQILAESSKRVSEARKAEHPQVRWRELAGLRNVVFTTIWASVWNGYCRLSAKIF
jgi:uncharacterized protein with HEPN domain